MPGKDVRHRMAVAHEEHVALLLDGRQSRGSGNQWHRPMDGRQSTQEVPYAFAWDCKATLAASQSVSLATWHKAEDQSGAERPCVPLRYYGSERLDVIEDLVVIGLDDFAEILADARKYKRIEALSGRVADGLHSYVDTDDGESFSEFNRDLQEIIRHG